MALSAAAKAKRREAQEERLFAVLTNPVVLAPLSGVLGAVTIQKLGEARIINRDFAGFLLSAWVAIAAAQAGIHDKWALGALTAAATAAYSVSTPPRDDETLIEVNPSKLLGGDGKLFWWDIPLLPNEM